MAKLKFMLLLLVGIGTLIFIASFLFLIFKPKVAGIYIFTNPSAIVYINGNQVGATPYKAMRDPGEVVLKLLPDTTNTAIKPYEARIALLSGVETVIRYDFGSSDDTASGEIISFEKIGKGETSLAIVSIPDSTQIVIDGSGKAFTPYKTSSVTPGDHAIVLSAKGYQDKTIKVKTHEGYKLTAIVTLAKGNAEPTTTVTPTPTPQLSEQVLILQTTPGFVRVRETPSTTAKELAQVSSGKSFPYLARDTATGWYKIMYEEGKAGWVSSQYTKLVGNKNETPTPTKTISPKPSPILTPTPIASPTLAG